MSTSLAWESEVQGEEFIGAVLREGGVLRFEFTIPRTQIENPSWSDNYGVSPASKAAIATMTVVKISSEEEGGECTICLTEYGIGEKVKEMACKHRYHSSCIEKWLGIHGSCPVCRYEMPVDNEREEEWFILLVFLPGSSGEWNSSDGQWDSDDSDLDHGEWDSDGGDWGLGGGEGDSEGEPEWSESGDIQQD